LTRLGDHPYQLHRESLGPGSSQSVRSLTDESAEHRAGSAELGGEQAREAVVEGLGEHELPPALVCMGQDLILQAATDLLRCLDRL
jgi:hypothetical protein